MDLMRFDDAFANSKYIAGGDGYPARWTRSAAAFRQALGARARLGLRYGQAERNWFDLFLPEGDPKGLMVFVHGGFWIECGPRDFSHLAGAALARGWAAALPAYTLAPGARITQMGHEIGAALAVMAAEVAGPVVVTGHSAGGHLAARMAAAGTPMAPATLARVRRVLPISPLSDLRPLIETSMQALLQIDQAEAHAESPALLPKLPGVDVRVWVGGSERPSFLDQARRLGNGWSVPVTIEPRRHHFDVIEGLETAESPLAGMLFA